MTAKADPREADWIKYQNNLQAIQQLQNENIVLVARIKDYEPPAPEPMVIQGPVPQEKKKDDRELITVAEAAKMLNLTPPTVRSLMAQEKLRGFAVSNKFRLYRSDVLAYLEKECVIRKDTAFKKAMAR